MEFYGHLIINFLKMSIITAPFSINFISIGRNILNPNLQAQKGLFTFIVDDVNYLFKKSHDERLIGELNGNKEENQHWFTGQYALVANVHVPEDEFLFYLKCAGIPHLLKVRMNCTK